MHGKHICLIEMYILATSFYKQNFELFAENFRRSNRFVNLIIYMNKKAHLLRLFHFLTLFHLINILTIFFAYEEFILRTLLIL